MPLWILLSSSSLLLLKPQVTVTVTVGVVEVGVVDRRCGVSQPRADAER